MLTEHSMVVLNCDLPDKGLHTGDVGAIVHAYRKGDAFEVEFVDGDGTTIAVLTLDSDDIRPMEPGELLHTRRRGLAEQSDEPKSR